MVDAAAPPRQGVPVTLILDLVRHGEAEPSGPQGDRGRRLTSNGSKAIRALGERLARAGPAPTRIFASPLARAMESARIIGGSCAPGLEVEALAALEPEAEPDGVIEALAALEPEAGHAVLVGHMPQLGELHLKLTGESASFAVATLRRIVFAGPLRAGGGAPSGFPGAASGC